MNALVLYMTVLTSSRPQTPWGVDCIINALKIPEGLILTELTISNYSGQMINSLINDLSVGTNTYVESTYTVVLYLPSFSPCDTPLGNNLGNNGQFHPSFSHWYILIYFRPYTKGLANRVVSHKCSL